MGGHTFLGSGRMSPIGDMSPRGHVRREALDMDAYSSTTFEMRNSMLVACGMQVTW
jgi:hypothetical protein